MRPRLSPFRRPRLRYSGSFIFRRTTINRTLKNGEGMWLMALERLRSNMQVIDLSSKHSEIEFNLP